MKRVVAAVVALGVLSGIDADSVVGGGPEPASDVGADVQVSAAELDPGVLRWLLRSRTWWQMPEQMAPLISDITHDSMKVSWTAPESGGFEIVDYDVQYREEEALGTGFVDWVHDGAATATTITGLVELTEYRVRVRAVSEVGEGEWSVPVNGRTLAEVTLLDLVRLLQERPRIPAAMVWFGTGTDDQPKPYAGWSQALKGKLALAVRRQLMGDGSGLPEVMTNQAAAVLSDDSYVTTVLSDEDAENLYVANVAHTLVLEMSGALPWSLDDLSEHELALLMGGRVEGVRQGGFYSRYVDEEPGLKGYSVRGQVLPAPPEVAYEFMAEENLIGDSRYETVIRTIEWVRQHLVHFSGGLRAKNVEDQWGYRGVPPLARMLAPTITRRHRDGRRVGITAGCHGTNWFLIHLLRAVNIPVEYVVWAGHAIPSFPSERMYLSHGDDPYNGFTQYWPPFPEPFPASEIPIPEATYAEWFSASNSSEENLRNVGRRVIELGVEYLPPTLLEARCWDLSNGVTDNETSYVYSPEFAGIGLYWTVAELEAKRFWERMDAKIEQYGGCSIFGY